MQQKFSNSCPLCRNFQGLEMKKSEVFELHFQAIPQLYQRPTFWKWECLCKCVRFAACPTSTEWNRRLPPKLWMNAATWRGINTSDTSLPAWLGVTLARAFWGPVQSQTNSSALILLFCRAMNFFFFFQTPLFSVGFQNNSHYLWQVWLL